MAQEITGYQTAGVLAGTEEVGIVQSGALKKTTTQDIADLGGGGTTSLPIQSISMSGFGPSENNYIGNSDISTSYALHTDSAKRVTYIAQAGTITSASINGTCPSTVGTAEDWSLYVRVNDTTDYLIATVATTDVVRNWVNIALSIPIIAGDFVEVKSVNPAWATPPNVLYYAGYITVSH